MASQSAKPGKPSGKKPSREKRPKLDTGAHIDRIADAMARGAWITGASARAYAKEHGVNLDTVRGWSSTASRIVRAGTNEERAELTTSTLAKLEVMAARAQAAGDIKAGVAALSLLSDIAGLKAPKRLEVNATIAEAPGELSVLMQRASDPQLPEAERDEAAEQFKAALLIKLLDDIDAMPNRERRAELVAMVRAKAAAYGEAPLLLTESGAA